MRVLKIDNNNALAVSAEMVGAAVEGVDDGPYFVASEWVDEMVSLIEEMGRARSTGDIDGLIDVCVDVERLISELLEVDGED